MTIYGLNVFALIADAMIANLMALGLIQTYHHFSFVRPLRRRIANYLAEKGS